jgi:glycosyltransferase involved in cell wall biosynthesis
MSAAFSDPDLSPLPSATIVVAVYNGARTLRECLDSITRLDYPAERLEIVCVDNASTDATPQILAGHAARCRLLREAKRGPAAARNAGVRNASGEVVAFTDADCTVDPGWLRHLACGALDAGVGISGGTILSQRPCNAIESFGQRIHDHRRAITAIDPPYAITMNWASRRDLLAELGGFNEELLRCSDVDLSYRMLQAGYSLRYEPRAVVYHRNERTPWGLLHEGYVHGFHAVKVRMLHAAFLREAGRRASARRRGATSGEREPLDSRPRWSELPWRSLFTLGKRIGHRHGAWAAAARRVS